MPAWLIWLIAAGVLAAAETMSLTLVLAMCAGGAGAAAITAAVGGPVFAQFLVAIVTTAALLGVVRPVARRHLLIGDPARTGTDALIGMDAVVLSKVDGFGGLVRLNGSEWSARTADPDAVLAAGTVVHVVEIVGATAVVWAASDSTNSGA